MGQSPQAMSGQATQGMIGVQQKKVDTIASEFAPGGSQSVDAWWKSIEPYFDKASTSATEYASGQLGALRGSTGSQLVEGGVAPGSNINSAFLGSIAPAISELAKYRSNIQASKGGMLAQLFSQNANIRTGLVGHGWQGVNSMIGASQTQSSSTPGGDFMGMLQSLVSIGVPGAALLNPDKYGFLMRGH